MSTPAYEIGKDAVSSRAPDCVIAVLPFDRKETFDYGNRRSGAVDQATIGTGEFLLLDKAATQVTVSSTKRDHTLQSSVVFFAMSPEVFKRITPGDWVFIWMGNDSNKMDIIRNALSQPKFSKTTPLNTFHSGLKFVGRMASLREVSSISENGTTTFRFTMNSVGFSELDADVYYDPTVTGANNDAYLFLPRLAEDMNKFYDQSDPKRSAMVKTVSQTVQFLLDVFLGNGPSRRTTAPGVGTIQVSPNQAYLVPRAVGGVLGRKTISGANRELTYSDILTTMYGIQKYSNPLNEESPTSYFTPQLQVSQNPQRLLCPIDLQGDLLFMPTPWVGVPVWGIVQSYLIPAMNEMYTTLRVDPDGYIQPTLVVRQIPFNSEAYANGRNKVTSFASLPRWGLSKNVVRDESLGVSDSLRVNFVKVFMQAYWDVSSAKEVQAANVKAVMDEEDIKRNGLAPYIGTVPVLKSPAITNQAATPSAGAGGKPTNHLGQVFTNIIADRLIGGHLRLSGTINAKGIQEPIPVGDNLVYRDYLYHIEGITHSFSIDQKGAKAFDTLLQVSNGVSVNPVANFLKPDLSAIPHQIIQGEPLKAPVALSFSQE